MIHIWHWHINDLSDPQNYFSTQSAVDVRLTCDGKISRFIVQYTAVK